MGKRTGFFDSKPGNLVYRPQPRAARYPGARIYAMKLEWNLSRMAPMNITPKVGDPRLPSDDESQRRWAEMVRDAEACLRSVCRGLMRGEHPERRYLGENLIRAIELDLHKLAYNFPTFSAWVIAPQPRGLHLRDFATAKRLRRELLDAGLHGVWADLLPNIVRETGRPKRVVDSDDFNRFWPAGGSDTGVDRRIMKLYRSHHAVYERLVSREIAWAQADPGGRL